MKEKQCDNIIQHVQQGCAHTNMQDAVTLHLLILSAFSSYLIVLNSGQLHYKHKTLPVIYFIPNWFALIAYTSVFLVVSVWLNIRQTLQEKGSQNTTERQGLEHS